MTKRAQFPFSAWLPAAMNAPTPVRTLVHSSTLVTAGIYLILRFQTIFISTQDTLLPLTLFTTLRARILACIEKDLKKIVAYSTLSQLGFMFSMTSIKAFECAFFHMLTHAGFKSLLFIRSGLIILKNLGSQSFLKSYNIDSFLSQTILIVSLIGLTRIPFMSGFYSKDLFIELSLVRKTAFLVSISFYFSIFLTSCYSIRIFFFLNFSF